MTFYLFFAFVFALLIIVFGFQNMVLVSVKFMVWETQGIPLAFIILGAASLGVLLALMLGMIRAHKLKRTIKNLESMNENLRRRVKALEQAPEQNDIPAFEK